MTMTLIISAILAIFFLFLIFKENKDSSKHKDDKDYYSNNP